MNARIGETDKNVKTDLQGINNLETVRKLRRLKIPITIIVVNQFVLINSNSVISTTTPENLMSVCVCVSQKDRKI